MIENKFFKMLEEKLFISKIEFLTIILFLVFYYVFLKYQQQWIITSSTIDIYNEGAT